MKASTVVLFEILRRIAAMALLLGGLWLVIYPGSPVYRVVYVDFVAQYENRPFANSDPSGLLDFIQYRTKDRTRAVQGVEWEELLAAAEKGDLYLSKSDPLFEAISPLPNEGYLRIQGEFLFYIRQIPTRFYSVPEQFAYPWRIPGLVLILLVLPCYFLIPKRPPEEGEIRYERGPAIVGPDLLGMFGAGIFIMLPLLISISNSHGSELINWDGGWQWLIGAFWLMAAIFSWLLVIATRCACSWYIPRGAVLHVVHAGRALDLTPQNISEVREYERNFKKLSTLLILFGGSLAATGLGISMRHRKEVGLDYRLTDGSKLRIMFNALAGGEGMRRWLKDNGVTIKRKISEDS